MASCLLLALMEKGSSGYNYGSKYLAFTGENLELEGRKLKISVKFILCRAPSQMAEASDANCLSDALSKLVLSCSLTMV